MVNIEQFLEKLSAQHQNFKANAATSLIQNKDWLIDGYAKSLAYKKIFKKLNISVHTTLRPELNTIGLKVGDLVTYTNQYGFCFPNFEVIGFDNFSNNGDCVYLNFDSYWCPVSIDTLTIQDGLLFLNENEILIAESIHQKNS